MSLLAALRYRMHKLLHADAYDRELREELDFHLTLDAAQQAAMGATSDVEARGRARRRFGNRTRYQEEAREMHGLGFLELARQDARFALRMFRRAPAFTAVALVTIALGIGATAAVFSVVNAVVLRPLPYPDADRVVMVWLDNRRLGLHEDVNSYPNLMDLAAQTRTLSVLAPISESGINLTGSGDPQRLIAGQLPAAAFTALGVAPAVGRLFTVENEQTGNDGVVLLSDGLWRAQFAGDRAVVGRNIELNGRPRTVIGVMPPGFAFPSERTQLWVPLVVPEQLKSARGAFAFPAVGRLAPGTSLDQARSELAGIATRLEREYPGNRGYGVYLLPLPEQVVGPTLRVALWVMLAAVAAVLLIACANVANLLLSRAAVREREVTVRLALGASGNRLVRQLLTESLLLSLIGGLAGVAVAFVGVRALRALAPTDLPRVSEIGIDGTVLVVTAALTVLTGIAFGLVPALRSARATGLGSALREGGRAGTAGRGGRRIRNSLVASQLALVVVLLTGAGLLIRTFVTLERVALGFDGHNVLTATVQLPRARYGQPGQALAFYDALLSRLRATPGVASAATVSSVLLSPTPNSVGIIAEGRAALPDDKEVTYDAASPGFFATVGTGIVAGRDFSESDQPKSQAVAIVNEHMARTYWPGTTAIGKRFRFGSTGSDTVGFPWLTVVGVVANMRRTGADMPVRDEVFTPYSQDGRLTTTLVVRSTTSARQIAGAVAAAVRAIDPRQPVFDVRPLDDLLAGRVAQRRFTMTLVGAFAALALVLALIGAYGVTSYLVTQRTKEIGVRLALGADTGRVARVIVLQGMRVAAVGVAVGAVISLGATRLLAGLLYGVSPRDPLTLAAVVVALLGVTAAANYLPARRAAHVDPLVALRED